MTYIIAEPCVDLKDGACIDVCPVDCIYTPMRTVNTSLTLTNASTAPLASQSVL